jgi:hypothetical protein
VTVFRRLRLHTSPRSTKRCWKSLQLMAVSAWKCLFSNSWDPLTASAPYRYNPLCRPPTLPLTLPALSFTSCLYTDLHVFLTKVKWRENQVKIMFAVINQLFSIVCSRFALDTECYLH